MTYYITAFNIDSKQFQRLPKIGEMKSSDNCKIGNVIK